jgi:hypothetical protein
MTRRNGSIPPLSLPAHGTPANLRAIGFSPESFRMVIHLSADARIDDVTCARARALGELATGFYPNMDWQSVEPQMASDWQRVRGNSQLPWTEVREEARAAWQVARLNRDGRMCDTAPVRMPHAA